MRTQGLSVPDLNAGISVAAARQMLAQTLRQHGIDSPDLDARLLVGHALGLTHTDLARDAARALTAAEADAVAALLTRRLAREPVARILGAKEFWGLSLKLNGDTLVPRPETETVVEAALDAIGERRSGALRIADLGTGSGALLLALLSECPRATGVGTDVSAGALACARGNAQTLGLAERATFTLSDYGAALAGPFDLVVSNPPYVRRDDIVTLQPEVRQFDPLRALDGGPDGLAAYRVITADARRLLRHDGVIVVELGEGQLAAVTALFTAAGLAVEAPRYDLLAIARALPGRPLP
jgi:release factor glutamine methyltransferase